MVFLFTILIMIWLNWYEYVAVVWSWSFYYMIKIDKEQLDWRFSPHDQLAVLMSPALFSPDPVNVWETVDTSNMGSAWSFQGTNPHRSGLSLLEVLAHGQDGNHPILVYTPSMRWTPSVFKVALWLSLSDVGDLWGPFLHVSTQLQLRNLIYLSGWWF
jgi:hypothetical protein